MEKQSNCSILTNASKQETNQKNQQKQQSSVDIKENEKKEEQGGQKQKEGENQKSLTLTQVRNIMRQFVSQRQWHQFHTPRNLLLALVGQVGQVSQIFQWKGQVKQGLPQFSQKQKLHVGEELADVLSYLIRLSDVCGVDLSKAFQDKVQKNKNKYPKDLVKGSSKKYSEYKQQAKEEKIQKQGI